MFIVHAPLITPRLEYTFSFVFNDILRVSYKLTSNKEEFISSELPKISYGKDPVGDSMFMQAHPILFETEIYRQKVEFHEWNGLPVFFSVDNGELPFDLFASTFFLVSRYEEYLPGLRDKHNRYRSEESTSHRGGFLDRPIVNLWAEEFKKAILSKYPSIQFPAPVFTFTPTIDIDNAYAYKYKGSLRILAGLLGKLASFKFKKFSDRLSVHLGRKKDPYDSYDKIRGIHKIYQVNPLYFILLGDYGKYDKNIDPENKNFVNLIQSFQEYAYVGLHPSYQSNNGNGQLAREKARLESILGREVTRSRQHYIRLDIPHTYRNLIDQGIREDYSMGFPSKVGFRAGTATPFYFFDVERNQKTDLKIYPFVMMDSTMKYYLRFRSKEVIPYMEPIVNELKRVGGNFVFIFHNESLGESKTWKNWGNMYEKMIRLCMETD